MLKSSMKTHAYRILPGQDLRQEIDNYVVKNKIEAGCILTCVGNLSKVVIRMAGYTSAADTHSIKDLDGPFEIVSLVGTVELGNSHLHISISDNDGVVYGGHLKSGSIIGITAEVVIGELEGKKFTRIFDSKTGFDELVVNSIKG